MSTQGFDSMFSQVAGSSPAPSSGPETISVGNDTPDSTTSSGAGASSAQPSQPTSFDAMFSQVSGQSGQADQSDNAAPKPAGGFLHGLAESTGVSAIPALVKSVAQKDQQDSQRALDYYHKAVAAHAQGDNIGAAEAASQFLLTATSQGLQKSYAPFIEAAKMIITDPIKAVQEQRAINQKIQADAKAGVTNPNTLKAVWDHVKQDWKNNNPDAAATDVLSGTLGQPGVNAIPLVGPVVSSTVNNLNEATHAPGGEDYGRILGDTVGTLGTIGLGGLLGKGGEALAGAGRSGAVEGLEAGQAGVDAAQTAADTAKAHDMLLQANKDKFQQKLDTATEQADREHAAATEQHTANKTNANNEVDENAAANKENIRKNLDKQHQAIDDTLDKAKQEYAQQFQQSLGTQANGAVPPEDLAPKVNEGINKYEQQAHEDFEEGMNGEGGVIAQLEGHSEPVMGSPFQEMAAERLKKPVPDDHPYAHDAADLANDKIDPKLAKKLENWSKGVQEVETAGPADASGNPIKVLVKKPVGDFTADQLVKIRQSLRKSAAALQRGDINRNILGDMIGSVDDTLQKLAESADNPDVLQQYEGLRKNYKTARANLDSSVADKLRLDSPDKALSDVNKYLMQGNNAPAKIQTIGSIVGEDTMQGLRQSYIQQLSKMAPEDAIKQLSSIPDAVKQAFFGPELDGKLSAAQSVYEKSVAAAEQAAETSKGLAEDATDRALRQTSTQAKYDKQANSAESRAAKAKIEDDYQEAIKTAKAEFERANAPYGTNFTRSVSKGTLAEDLANDKIAKDDITALKDAMDPDEFGKIQTGTWNRALADATTGGRFNPVKFLDWVNSIDPDTFHEMFSGNPNNTVSLDKAVADIQDAAKMQKLVRAGIGVPVAGGAATAINLLPHTAMFDIFEAAGLLGAASRKSLITNLLDSIATRPSLLRAMTNARNTVTGTAEMVGKGLKAPAAKFGREPGITPTEAGKTAAPSLAAGFGRRVTVDGHPGTQVGVHPKSGKPVIVYHDPGQEQ